MCDEDRRVPYDWDAVEIGFHVGHVTQLTSQKRSKRKRPMGFQAPSRSNRIQSGSGPEWPDVPHFDVVGDGQDA